MRKYLFILGLALTACNSSDGGSLANSDDGLSSGATPTPTAAPSTESSLQGTWLRVGEYCGTTYSTGLTEQYLEFTTSAMNVDLRFVCDSGIHVAQEYTASFATGSVTVTQTQSATSSCPMVYASAGSPSPITYPIQILADDTMQMTVGTCTGSQTKVDVYHKQ